MTEEGKKKVKQKKEGGADTFHSQSSASRNLMDNPPHIFGQDY